MVARNGENRVFRGLRTRSGHYRAVRSATAFFSLLVRLAAPGLVVLMTGVFLSKVLWPPLFWSVWAMPLWVAGISLYLLSRRPRWLVPPWRARALADLRTGNRGLYMAVEEAGGGEWAAELTGDGVAIAGPFATWSAVNAALLAVALMVLLMLPDLRPPQKTAGPATPVERMRELVTVLAAADPEDDNYLGGAKELLAKMKEGEGEGLDSGDWQALDSMMDQVKRRAADSYRKLDAARRDADRLADGLARDRTFKPEDGNCFGDMLDRLSEEERQQLLDDVASRGPLSQEQLAQLLGQCRDGQAGQLSDAEIEALQQLLEGMEGMMAERWGEVGECLGGLGFAPEDLAGICGGPGGEGEPLGGEADGLPGRGGVDRGPGPAPLTLGGDTGEDFGRFQAETFKGNAADLTVSLGHALAPPGESGTPEAGGLEAGPARGFSGGNERLTWHSRLLPGHNDVLKRYFATEGTEGSE